MRKKLLLLYGHLYPARVTVYMHLCMGFCQFGRVKEGSGFIQMKGERKFSENCETHKVCAWLRAGENSAQVEPVQENTPFSNQNSAQAIYFSVQGTPAVLLSCNLHP